MSRTIDDGARTETMHLLRRRAARITLDIGLLLGFAAEFLTREGPDYDLHSWVGVALLPVIGVHLASNWRWVTAAWKRATAHPEWPLARFDAVFSVVTAVCIVTGFPPWLGWTDGGAMAAVHNVTGLISIVLAISHLWRNRQRVRGLLRRAQPAPTI